MESKRRVLDNETKSIQLEMLVEIDSFCRQHNLKYILAYGTLIGAIRHKGFIPWDNDLDICMSYKDMLYLKENFNSSNVEIYDIDSQSNHLFPFPRIVHKHTYSEVGMSAESNGVFIDLYVMIPCTSDKNKFDKIISQGMNTYNLYKKAKKWSCRILKFLPLKKNYFLKYFLKRYTNFLYDKLFDETGENFFCIASPLTNYRKDVLDYNIFENLIEAEFEGHRFYIPSCYDKYLSQQYGDYMTPPPMNKRVPYHCGTYYWK